MPSRSPTLLLDSPELAGIHFTGSTAVFNSMWKKVGENIGKYRGYPRLVGETGGKDFIVAHPSADPQEVAVAIARGGFEYQGQKCSAASRVYVPQSLWNEVRDRTVAMMKEIKVGDVRDFRNFMGAVIDKKAFTKISGYLDDAKKNAKVLQGGGCEGRAGLLHRADAGRDRRTPAIACCARRSSDRWSRPTSIPTRSGTRRWRSSIATSPYALTGAVFARDRAAVREATQRAAQRRRQLLHQRQADRRGGRPAAVRRRARLGHQRQGGLEAEPGPLGQRAHDQGNVRAAARLHVSVHGRGVAWTTSATP